MKAAAARLLIVIAMSVLLGLAINNLFVSVNDGMIHAVRTISQ